MKKFSEYIENHDSKKPASDGRGGFTPTDGRIAVYRNADLITLPPQVEGTNCGNCRFFSKKEGKIGKCNNKEIQDWVTTRMCCKFWDNSGVIRQFNVKA